MNIRSIIATVAAIVSLVVVGASVAAAAPENGVAPPVEFSVMGGVQALNKNDTALPDNFINIPAVATVTYRLTPLLAAEGEFTWMIPVAQSVDLGSSASQDRKTPDILAYQANLKANLPFSGTPWTPYLAAGAGVVTFLSNTDSDRLPVLNESQTVFAINFGAGTSYGLNSRWAVRADFREFAAFPPDDATGLSTGNKADPIWMERGTLGLAYRF